MRIWVICAFLTCFFVHGQEITSHNDSVYLSQNIQNLKTELNTKNPLKASLYSTILPGLGQVYNEKYWKVPIVWGLLGTGIGFTTHYNNRYHHFRDAYIAELNGEEHPYTEIFGSQAKERLAYIQDDMRRNRDYAIALTVLAYALNILDATVDAHLYEVRKDKDLSIDPTALVNPVSGEAQFGLAVKINLK